MKAKRKDPFAGKLADYDTFVNNVYNQTFAKRVAWAIDVTVLAALLILVGVWNAKWAIAKEKKTATTTDRKARNTAKKALTAAMRPFVQTWIYRNDAMSDADITSCGLDPHKRVKSKVPAPDTEPYIQFKPKGTHVLGVYFRQGAAQPGVNNRGKPDGVASVRVAYFVGDNPPANPNDFPKLVIGTRSPLEITFLPEDAGKKITLAACWVTATNLAGKWNAAQSTTIP